MAGQRQVGNARTPPGGGLARPKMPLRLSGVPVWAAFPRRSLRSMSPDAATSTGASARERLDALVARLGVRGLLLLSLAFLVPQQALTRYLRGEDGANVFWLAVGFLLLWFVYRRSSLAARAFSVYTAVIGALPCKGRSRPQFPRHSPFLQEVSSEISQRLKRSAHCRLFRDCPLFSSPKTLTLHVAQASYFDFR